MTNSYWLLQSKDIIILQLESHTQTLPSSRKEKGSGVTSPNPSASSRNVKRPMKLQSGVYWNNAEARTSTSIGTLKMKFIIHTHTDKFAMLHKQLQGFNTSQA